MTRLYGRARKGERVKDYAPHGHWNTTTLVAAIPWESPIAPMVLDGAMDTISFEAYVEQLLIPQLPPNAIVIMDNLSAHKSRAMAQLLQSAGAELRYLPPYSPDLNPIEMMWSKVKSNLRSVKARTLAQLDKAIAMSMEEITAKDIQGFFRHSFVSIIS